MVSLSVFPSFSMQACQPLSQPGQRAKPRCRRPALLDIADGSDAEPGAHGKLVLGQACIEPTARTSVPKGRLTGGPDDLLTSQRLSLARSRLAF
jgi:hypothetical protein